MAGRRIRLDSRADHNRRMAELCREAAARLDEKIRLTKDPAVRQALRRRMREHQAQSERHRDIAEGLASRPMRSSRANLVAHS